MPLRRHEHLLEELAVSLLDPAAARHLGFGSPEADGKGVADRLELGHAEHARAADGSNAEVDPLAREGGGEELTEPALQQRDLAAQLEADPAVGERSLARGQPSG